MAGNIKRMIKEEGVVLEKIFKGATTEFKNANGDLVAAQPDRYILRCVSGEDFSEEYGFSQSTVLDYKTDETSYNKAKVYAPVTVKYEVSNYGTKAMGVELQTINKK